MKNQLIICFLLHLCFGQLVSQELRLMPRHFEDMIPQTLDFDFKESTEDIKLTAFQLGSDMYNLEVVRYALDQFSFGMNARLEEELPYERGSYDYTGFYYLDFGINYVVDNLSFGISIENFLNLNNDSFTIDPIIGISNGIVNRYYFSHETDALISMTLAYSF